MTSPVYSDVINLNGSFPLREVEIYLWKFRWENCALDSYTSECGRVYNSGTIIVYISYRISFQNACL